MVAVLSAAKPKIADYPFTTLVPNLGIVRWGEKSSFAVADIPGIIEGAHEGKGLGLRFLRHIERTSFLLYMVDVSEWAPEEPVKNFEVMRQELAAYDEPITARPFAVVATKIDTAGDGTRLRELQKYCKRHCYPCLAISAATRDGLTELVNYVGQQVTQLRAAPCEISS